MIDKSGALAVTNTLKTKFQRESIQMDQTDGFAPWFVRRTRTAGETGVRTCTHHLVRAKKSSKSDQNTTYPGVQITTETPKKKKIDSSGLE